MLYNGESSKNTASRKELVTSGRIIYTYKKTVKMYS